MDFESYRFISFRNALTHLRSVIDRFFAPLFYSPRIAPLFASTRHVILPKELAKTLSKTRLLHENEWRQIGVQQSRGWQHYAIHRPEPHILLFRRPLGTDPQTGKVDQELKRVALEEYKGQFGLRI